MVEMIVAEQRARLIYQLLVLRDLVRLVVQLVRIVGDDVERHIMAEIDRLEMEARENRRILQRLIIDRLIGDGRARLLAAQRRRRLPAVGIGHGRLAREDAKTVVEGKSGEGRFVDGGLRGIKKKKKKHKY